MAEQMRPASPEAAPDPSNNYERSHPEREAGMGRLDNNVSTPTQSPDRQDDTVKNKQRPEGQLNAQDATSGIDGGRNPAQPAADARPAPQQPDHSMKDEEPLGWDQAPTDIKDPQQKRHPRTDGTGATR